MNDSKDSPNLKTEPQPPTCSCVQNPYASLPPELRPQKKSWKTGFRQVTCPGCGLQFWTNMESDVCMDCQKKGIQIPRKEPEK